MTILTNKYFQGFIVALAVVIGVWFYGNRQYHNGYEAATAKAQIEMLEFKNEIAVETTETIKRTQAAAQKAKELQDQKIAELESTNDQLEKTLKENEDEAAKEPNRGRIGLDSSSVLRIDKIK